MGHHPQRDHDLQSALEVWHAWSRVEGDAIEQEDWPRVRECQEAKAGLRESIEGFLAAGLKTGAETSAWPHAVRQAVGQLISLERENAARLASRRAFATTRKAELEGAAHNLHRVRQSYRGLQTPSWSSYS